MSCGTLILVSIVIILIFGMFLAPPYDARVDASAVSHKKSDDPKSRVYSRDEFKSLVMNKVPGQLLETVGAPSLTSTSGDTQYWYYSGRTIDPITGKIDTNVQVVIGQHNLVAQVNF